MKQLLFIPLFVLSLIFLAAPLWASPQSASPPPSGGFTDVCGTLTEDTNWTAANSPYVITCEVTVPSTVTLTIEPGVIVKVSQFDSSDGELAVWGGLIADGTQSQPIVFTSFKDDSYGGDTNGDGNATTPAPGDWEGILLFHYYDSTFSGLSNTVITYSSYGFYAQLVDLTTELSFENNTFTNNGFAPVSLYFIGGGGVITASNNIVSDNDLNGLAIGGGTDESLSFDLRNQIDWPVVFPYDGGGFGVASGTTLTFSPGTIVKFLNSDLQSSGLDVGGTLIANGTESQPVVFTSLKDDSYGGDTNGDGDATTPAPGDWKGIVIDLQSLTSGLSNAVIAYSEAGLQGALGTGTEFRLENNLFTNNEFGLDLILQVETEFIFEDNTFTNNINFPASLTTAVYGVLITASGNLVEDNGTNGLYLYNGSVTLDWSNQTDWAIVPADSDFGIDTLTLSPGTVVKFNGGGLDVGGGGALITNGTAGQPVVFTSIKDDSYGGDTNGDGDASTPASGDWEGIYFREDSTFTGLQNTVIAYSAIGLQADLGPETEISLQNNILSNNLEAPVFLNFVSGGGVITASDNVVLDNGINGVLIEGTISGSLSLDWSNQTNWPLLFRDGGDPFQVPSGTTLSLSLGTVVKGFAFDFPYAGLGVYGTLIANGSASQPVVFTSLKDDSYGGDTNGDGDASTPAPGDWGGIYFNESSTFSGLQNVVIAYSYNGLRADLGPGTELSLQNNTFTNNLYTPVFLYFVSGGGVITASDNVVLDNGINGVEIAGTINGSLSLDWSKQTDWPLLFTGNGWDPFEVPSDATLTLSPGTVVKGSNSDWTFSSFDVHGTLIADGTASQPIVFTSFNDDSYGGDTNNDGDASTPAPGDWGGIGIDNGATFSGFQHVVMAYSASGLIVNRNTSTELSFENNLFSDNLHFGLYLLPWETDIQVNLNQNVFTDNRAIDSSAYPLFIEAVETSGIITASDNIVSGNDFNGVVIKGTMTESLTLNWSQQTDWPIVFVPRETIAFEVPNEATLSLSPGTVVKGSTFDVHGTLLADGTQSQPIVFTSFDDDFYGGDTNGDGDATSPLPGDWAGINLHPSSTGNILDHCMVAYGYDNIATETSGLSLTQCTIRQASENGLSVGNNAAPQALSDNNFMDNGTYGLFNDGGATVDARDNWWGDASGPYHATQNPLGLGDQVSDDVLFDPWLTSAQLHLQLTGPQAGTIGTSYAFSATVSPISATTPITYVWQATEQTDVIHSTGISDSVTFEWDLSGTKTITVSASNDSGTVSDTHIITITDIPTPTPTPTNTPTNTPTSPIPTVTSTPTAIDGSPTPTPTSTGSPMPTVTSTPTAIDGSPTPTGSPMPTVTSTPTAIDGSPTPTATSTGSPMPTVTSTATPTGTATPTVTDIVATSTPTASTTPTASASPIATTTIDPQEGGSLTSPDGMIELNFPPAAVSSNTFVTVTQQLTPSTGTGNFIFAGSSFDISATDANGSPVTTFLAPFTMTLTYSDADWQKAGINHESQLNLYWWDGNSWLGLLPCTGCQHDTINNRFVILLDHLTEFALLGKQEMQLYLPLLQK